MLGWAQTKEHLQRIALIYTLWELYPVGSWALRRRTSLLVSKYHVCRDLPHLTSTALGSRRTELSYRQHDTVLLT